MISRALCLFGLTLGGAAAAADTPAKPSVQLTIPPMVLPAATYTWPSGLRMTLAPDATRDVVVMSIGVSGGYTDDPNGRAGTARLFEAAWWSSAYDAGHTVRDVFVEDLGCQVESRVEHDVVWFQSACPGATAGSASAVWARLFTDPLAGIDEARLDAIAARVTADAAVRTHLDPEPLAQLLPWVQMQLFGPDHPYFVQPAPDLSRLSVADVEGWASEHLTAAGVSVHVMGGFSGDDVGYGQSLVALYWPPSLLHPKATEAQRRRYPRDGVTDADPKRPADWTGVLVDPAKPTEAVAWAPEPAPPSAASPAPVPGPSGKGFARFEGPVDEHFVLVGWALPASFRGDDALQDLTARMLGATVAQQFADEPAVERFSGCSLTDGLESAMLVCVAVLRDGASEQGERIARYVVDQVAIMMSNDPGDRMRLKVQLDTTAQLALTGNLRMFGRLVGLTGSRAGLVARGTHLAGKPALGLERLAAGNGIPLDPVVKYAETWLTRDRSVAVQIDPAERVERTLRVASDSGRNRDALFSRGSYWDRWAGSAAGARAPSGPEDWAAMVAGAERTSVHRLGNGLTVVEVRHGLAPVAALRLSVPGGTGNDPTAASEHVLARALMRQHREPAVAVGGQWFAFQDAHMHHVGLLASVGNVSDALWMIRALFDSAAPSLRDKGSTIKETRDAMVQGWYDPMWHAADLARLHIAADHPALKEPTWADTEVWSEMTASRAETFFRSKWRPERAVLTVVVPTDAAVDVKAAATRWLAGWAPEPPEDASVAPLPQLAPPALPSARAVMVLPRQGPVVDLQLTCAVAADQATVEAVGSLLAEAVDGSWTSRVVETRVHPGGTGIVTLRARTLRDRAATAVPAARARLDEAGKAAVPAAALSRGAATAAGMAAMRGWDPMLLSGQVAAAWAGGAPDDALGDERARFGAVTTEAVAKAAAACAKGAHVALIGDAEALTGAAGSGATVVDWQARGAGLHEAADPKGFKRYKR